MLPPSTADLHTSGPGGELVTTDAFAS